MECVDGEDIGGGGSGGGGAPGNGRPIGNLQFGLARIKEVAQYITDLYIWLYDGSILAIILVSVSMILWIVPFITWVSGSQRGPLNVAAYIFLAL